MSLIAPKNTREQIIQILSKEWPLSTKEIHEKLRKEFYSDISYQAVHKTLSEMCENKLLETKNRKFELNKTWLESQKNFFDETKAKYFGEENKYIIDPNFEGTLKFRFDDYSRLAVFMADTLAKKLIVGSNPSKGIGFIRHGYWPLEFKFQDFSLLHRMVKNSDGGYGIIKKNSPLDKWICEQYKKGDFTEAICGVDTKANDDLLIHGDGIMKIHYSEESKKKLDEIYNKVSNIEQLFAEFVKQKISKVKIDAEMTITKDPQISKMLKKQLIDTYFNGIEKK